MDASKWDRRKTVFRLRGLVEHVEPATADECVDEGLDKRLHDGKKQLLGIMCTKRNSDLADHWDKIFELALNEFQINMVMTK